MKSRNNRRNNKMVKTYSLKKDGSKKLSQNFTVSEFACKDGSDKVLIDTTLVDVLQKIRNHLIYKFIFMLKLTQ